MTTDRRRVVVIGVGNELRGDDAAGLEVVRRLRRDGGGAEVELHESGGMSLLELWEGAAAAVLVDATRSGAPLGTIRRFDVGATGLPATVGLASSHAVSVAEAIELARVLGRLPGRVTVFGIEGGRFDLGAGLSDGVKSAVDEMVRRVHGEVAAEFHRRAAEERPDGGGPGWWCSEGKPSPSQGAGHVDRPIKHV